MTITASRMRIIFVGLLATLATGAHAGIEKRIGAGYYPGALLADGEEFTNAIVNYAIDNRLVPTSNTMVDLLKRQAQVATLARFEYSWEENGQTRRVVVHSRSGRPIETVFKAKTESGSESGSTSFVWTDEQVDRELSEARYYPTMDGHLRATRRYDKDSALKATGTGKEAANRAGDAELKALQTLEAEFKAKNIPTGGKLVGIVSKDVCPSCQSNLDLFSETYGVDGKVYYLVEQREVAARLKLKPSDAERQLMHDSVVANQGLYQGRGRYIARVMPRGDEQTKIEWKRVDPGTWVRQTDLKLLAEAERGSILAEGCP